MNCNRCHYKIGFTKTRCSVCGDKPNRVKVNIVALTSAITGVKAGLLLLLVFHL